MDREYQRRIIDEDFGKLEQRLADDASLKIAPEWDSGILFVRMWGLAGETEPYLAKIEPWLYPVGPWRVGFMDPDTPAGQRLAAPDRDPRFWPYSQLPGAFGGFHVSFQREYRVFVCLPFTTEYFRYHANEPWHPHVYDIHRVVVELDRAVKRAVHFSIWRPMLYGGS